jgi:large subunit ribosomal protein L29|tara:strand:+ start:547 stop:768 length:222 start_codon:yes stop_codon:yes gene_type:complete
MRREELREMSVKELESRLLDNLEELENLRFQKALQQLENPLRIRHLRREIAQVKTALHGNELGIRSTSESEES